MNKLLAAMVCVAALSGCDTVKLTIAENNYNEAINTGNLAEQIALVDELYLYDSEKYLSVFTDKEQLQSVFTQLQNDPQNFHGISDQQLARVIAFAPNFEPFSFAKKHLAQKQRILADFAKAEQSVVELKARLADKLTQTPNHVETYPTHVSLNGLAPYFLSSNYARQLVKQTTTKQYQGKPLNSYQLSALVTALSDMFVAYQQMFALQADLIALSADQQEFVSVQAKREQGDIQRLLMWLYKQQLAVGFDSALESNSYLLSLLESKYGREHLDDVWLSLVEPAAKKAVMNAKKTYLNDLDLIATGINKSAGDNYLLTKVYKQTLALDKKLLELMWPPNGLDNFKANSEQVKASLKKSLFMINQQ